MTMMEIMMTMTIRRRRIVLQMKIDWDDDNKDGHDKRTQGVKEMKPRSLFEAPLPAVSTRH